MIHLKSVAEIDQMAAAGAIVADVLSSVEQAIAPGVTTGELDQLAEELIRGRGGVPTFKGYRGFPASICSSPNAMVVHGIPGEYAAAPGDLISVDVGVTLDGLVADSASTFAVGEIPPEAEALLAACQDALAAGIDAARVGNHIGDISAAVQAVTEDRGFSVIRTLVGHGVGRSMHEEPQVPNYGEPGQGPTLRVGMTLAIEPMITAGGPEVAVADDGWSISTVDDSLSAHFEHTVAITEEGPRVLTLPRATAPEQAEEALLR